MRGRRLGRGSTRCAGERPFGACVSSFTTGVRPIELIGERAAVAVQDGAGDREQQQPLALEHLVRAQQIHAAGTVLPRPPRAVVEQARDVLVRLIEIAHRMLVEDDDVRGETLQPPVFLRQQGLPDQRQRFLLTDPDQQDGLVAGNAVRPQGLPAERVARLHLSVRAQRAVQVEHT